VKRPTSKPTSTTRLTSTEKPSTTAEKPSTTAAKPSTTAVKTVLTKPLANKSTTSTKSGVNKTPRTTSASKPTTKKTTGASRPTTKTTTGTSKTSSGAFKPTASKTTTKKSPSPSTTTTTAVRKATKPSTTSLKTKKDTKKPLKAEKDQESVAVIPSSIIDDDKDKDICKQETNDEKLITTPTQSTPTVEESEGRIEDYKLMVTDEPAVSESFTLIQHEEVCEEQSDNEDEQTLLQEESVPKVHFTNEQDHVVSYEQTVSSIIDPSYEYQQNELNTHESDTDLYCVTPLVSGQYDIETPNSELSPQTSPAKASLNEGTFETVEECKQDSPDISIGGKIHLFISFQLFKKYEGMCHIQML